VNAVCVGASASAAAESELTGSAALCRKLLQDVIEAFFQLSVAGL
jgi:hypothetical protein